MVWRRNRGAPAALAGAGLSVAVLLGALVGAAPAGAAPAGPSAGPSAKGSPAAAGSRAGWRFDNSATSLADVSRAIGADRLHRAGVDGAGVGVALVDTGVVPVDGTARVEAPAVEEQLARGEDAGGGGGKAR